MLKEGFWENPESKEILQKRALLLDQQEGLETLESQVEELSILLELIKEEEDQASLDELKASLQELNKNVGKAELAQLLSEPFDRNNAIVTIHAGAGGTDSQDWADMLLRMYLRWSESHNMKVQMLDLMPGEEAGIKSATFLVQAPYAYGNLKSETGVHRLVRISPYDASGRRHTSFASVFVAPEVDENIQVDINEKDLRIDTYRASGAGGQHVNKTNSAVRITHIPTGLVVQCQNERSQHKNKAIAMKILRARLFEMEKERQDKKKQKIHGEKKEIAWGSQIRSYVLHPYQLVKDHRTGTEIGDVKAVLDGAIDPFIEAYLKDKLEQKVGDEDKA